MKNTEKSTKKQVTPFGGANSDVSYKIVGIDTEKGTVLNRRNLSVRSKDGSNYSSSDMGGDDMVFQNNLHDFDCICSFVLKDYLIEIWCPNDGVTADTKMTFNGVIMVDTPLLPFDINHQIQYDINESCATGEFFITDFKNTPYIFNLGDIIDAYNAGLTTYTTDFNPLLYQAVLNIAPHHPVFVGLVNNGNGLYVGKYNYAIRFSDSSGNKTNWSVQTPNIPVPKSDTTLGQASPTEYPSLKTYGASSDIVNRTSYGIHLRFRMENVAGYEFIEIRRCANIGGQALGYVYQPQYKKITKIMASQTATTNTFTLTATYIQDNPFAIFDWIDDGSSTDWADLTDEDDTQEISGSFKAKTLRYYQNRLVFMNIENQSKDVTNIDGLFIDKENRLGFPVVEKLTSSSDYKGHGNIYNNVYYPHLQLGEKYGWAVYFQDGYGTRSFALPFDDGVNDLKNYQMPNRRVPLNSIAASYKYSQAEWKGACYCSDINKQNNRTFEIFDLEDAIAKTDYCSWVNILDHDAGASYLQQMKYINAPFGVPEEDLDLNGCDVSFPHHGGGAVAVDDLINAMAAGIINYGWGNMLLNPTYSGDPVTLGHNYAINDYVYYHYTDGTDPDAGVTHAANVRQTFEYEPKGFRPNWFSTGMGFWGLKDVQAKIPWAKSFSIVRTKPAKRVVCQGIGFWALDCPQNPGELWNKTNKLTDRFWFYSPDTDVNMPNMGIPSLADIVANPSNYEIQLVSPVGGFSEIYSSNYDDASNLYTFQFKGSCNNVDMITYCRVLRESYDPLKNSGTINPSFWGSDCGELNGNGYVSYGRWLNTNQLNDPSTGLPYEQSYVWNSMGQNIGEMVFGISPSSSIKTRGNRGVSYAEFVLTSSGTDANGIGAPGGQIYNYAGICHSYKVGYPPHQFGEPFYVVNIIQRGVNVPYGNNVTEYVETGHLQKLDSLIGVAKVSIGATLDQSYQLVDERWEDCIVNDLSATKTTDNRYCWVNNRRWINISEKQPADILGILGDLASPQGYSVIHDIDTYGNPIDYNIYGVYTNTGTPSIDTTFDLLFTWSNTSYSPDFFLPKDGEEIRVKYDDRIPIRVFAGDTYLGEVNACMWDGKSLNVSGNNTYIDDPSDPGHNLFMCGSIPYQAHHINSRVYQALNPKTVATRHVQEYNFAMPQAIRQLMVNFICESKLNLPLEYEKNVGSDATDGIYPQTHYIMRSIHWDDSNENDPSDPSGFLADNHISQEYFNKYGYEWYNGNWAYGGFKIFGYNNIDYSKVLNDRVNSSKPIFGYKEITKFCSRIIWSNERQISVQDDPNLKSFPALNFFDISDAYEEIKYAYDNDSEKGNNLFAVTGKGICLLITDKQTITDANSDTVAFEGLDSKFISNQYWLSKDIGSNDQMWRGIAEYNNDLFIPNRRGVYMLDGLEIKNITANYGKELLSYLQRLDSGYGKKMYGVYNQFYEEYWLGVDSVVTFATVDNNRIKTLPKRTFIFCNEPDKLFWAGYSDYFYDNAAYATKIDGQIVNTIYGSKDFKSYKTGIYNGLIDGLPYNREVSVAITPQLTQTCELIDITCNSNTKPSFFRYNYEPSETIICETSQNVIRDYTHNYYAMCPRRADNGNRLQNDSFVIDVIYTGDEKFEVVGIESGFKGIKW